MTAQEKRAAAYLAKLPPAVAGNGGHTATFAAACRLVEFGLSFDGALPLLADWNQTHCDPTWTEAELRHKLADAFKRTSPKPCFAPGVPRPAKTSFSPMSTRQTLNQSRSYRILERPFSGKCDSPGEKAAPEKKLALPLNLRSGSAEDFAALAKLRGLSVAGVALASASGLLRFGDYYWQGVKSAAWFVCDASRRNACARRMDGQPWQADGAKSLLVRGALAQWPIGIGEATNFQNVLLCEGAPDLLAAFHFITTQGRADDCAPVAMLSAAYNVHPGALPTFAGKRVRIFQHDDATGARAASRWLAQIAPHAAKVDCICFAGLRKRDGNAVKDLNDFAQAEVSDENEKNLANLLP